MFSIAAINDTDSRGQWEPLAPTKEAQEFHLSQIYHDGLLKLQAKEYEKARELLETVLKDPLISNAQVDDNSGDSHLLQLRFLALKNLANGFLEQGSTHYESALRCYLQAVEIDTKDSVIWNQLGTLSCSMGLLSISRWAFEQGLICSPNNWNCMEKLLEVLIAIGDEVACLSVAELILRHWPSHSRALNVKNTIEESEAVPFAPRGIDRLEPKHVRLKFLNKRKTRDDDQEESGVSKKLNQDIELHVQEASWTALAGALLEILLPSNRSVTEGNDRTGRSRDIRLNIQLPHSSENVTPLAESKGCTVNAAGEKFSFADCDPEKCNMYDEQPQERRSSRLERLRSRKPGREETDSATTKDVAKVALQFLEPFIVSGAGAKDGANHVDCPFSWAKADSGPPDIEVGEVTRFIQETSKNYGASHMGHLLLEEVGKRGILYQDDFAKFLELEKLTRQWGQDRTPECSIFLAELYYDFGSRSSDTSEMCDFMSEASYHLCKIIESVALDYPFHVNELSGSENCNLTDGSECEHHMPRCTGSLLKNKCSLWIRFFWLSGRLSIFDDNRSKAREEFCMALSLITNKETMDNSLMPVHLPHCKVTRELTVSRIIHEINLLDVDLMLMETVSQMIEKDMYTDCISLLAPLLFAAKDIHLDFPCSMNREGAGFNSTELSALDVLIQACEKEKPINAEVYLNCHRRKLQILMVAAGVEGCYGFSETAHRTPGLKTSSASDTESKECPRDYWYKLITEEVKAISQCVSNLKNFINTSGTSYGSGIPTGIIGDIQSLLLALMSSGARKYLCKKSSVIGMSEDNDWRQRSCLIDAAVAFCKLQHLDLNVPVKTQTELIVATHDMLAEYGLCCASGDGEEEEGTFLKFAIKHLLALDMKLKSNSHSLNKVLEIDQSHEHDSSVERPLNDSKLEAMDIEISKVTSDDANAEEKDTAERLVSECTTSSDGLEKEKTVNECGKNGHVGPDGMFPEGQEVGNQSIECCNGITEEEKEELELGIDNALDQCFFCLYGLNLRSDSTYEYDLAMHKNTSRGEYQTKEQCADVFQYILPYAKASSRTGLIKLRRVLRAIRKHFPQPPDDVLTGNAVDRFLDDPDLCEDKLSEEAGSDGFLDSIMKIIFPDARNLNQQRASTTGSSEPYLEVYCNLYYLLAQSEELNATDKWPGFVLTKEGEEFVDHNAKLFKYDLLYNPLRFESWQRLANIYDEEVDLLLNDGSKQINVAGWRKNAVLPQRVETSRRRSRRCLLMTLALAKTAVQQGEIHELLALVYYDGVQSVVPFYDQRSVFPSRDAIWMMFCENSMRHFKKAFAHKEDWSHAFYLGKLCEKLKFQHDISFSYYDKAINLNPSSVDSFYRLHASRLKLLCKSGKHNEEALKVITAYSYARSTNDTVLNIFAGVGLETQMSDGETDARSDNRKQMYFHKLEEVWHILYSDCLSALQICVEGDLKHFHKARYMLSQGLYKRGESGDLEKAKEELSFCFKSSRSSFTINMWEIDGLVKKGRRKTPGPSGNRVALEVNLPESSRKFITCIRKYILFYLKLLEETGDICTLDRAYISIRTDKRFSLCLEDLVPTVLGRYIKALISSKPPTESDTAGSSLELVLEKIFCLFLEQVNLWSDICSLPEIKSPEITENSLSAYLYQYIQLLERNVRLETLEGINEKIRKRLKNPKLSNSNVAKVYRHVSVTWCRSLVIGMAMITPLHSRLSSEMHDPCPSDNGSEGSQVLCVDLQTDELWNSSFEDANYLKDLEIKWNPLLSKVKNVIIKKVSDEDLETSNTLLRSAYNFYRDTSCTMLPSGINLYMVPSQLATETYIQPGIEGGDILDLSTPRKLLLWAYTLLHGRCTHISYVVKYCEENAKSRMKKGTGISSVSSSPSTPATATRIGGGKDGSGKGSEQEVSPSITTRAVALPETSSGGGMKAPVNEVETPCTVESVVLPETESLQSSSSLPKTESGDDTGSVPLPQTADGCNAASACLPEGNDGLP